MKTRNLIFINLLILMAFISACKTTRSKSDDAYRGASDLTHFPDAEPKSEPLCRYGNPECYDVNGQKYYVLKSANGYCKKGLASWYGTKFHGKNTSSREPYDMFGMTAASRNLPIPTYVEVTNLENGKKIIVKVNDRGPFKSDRIIDLSYAAALKLGFANRGTANVEVKAINTHDLRNEKMADNILLANTEMAEIQVNPIALPTPQQTAKPITLERYLQLGAFANHENAVRLKDEIATYTDAKVLIKEGISNNKSIYRVQIGPFKTVKESETVLQILREQGHKDAITVFS